MSPTLNSLPHESFQPSPVSKNSLQQRGTWLTLSASHLFNYSFPAYMYWSIRFVNLYPYGKQLYQLAYSSTVWAFLALFLQTPLISKVTYVSTFFPLPSSVSCSYICNKVRLVCHILHFIMEFSHSLNDLLNLCTLKFILCDKV